MENLEIRNVHLKVFSKSILLRFVGMPLGGLLGHIPWSGSSSAAHREDTH